MAIQGSKELIKPYDATNPTYYRQGNVQTIDYIESLGHGEGYCVGAIIKYLSRYRQKNGLEDLYKARWYIDRLISLLEQESLSK